MPYFLAFKMPISVINMLLFGILNAKKQGNWHLNTRIWHFKCQRLAFMTLTPDGPFAR